jgi:hypothetical protein
MRRPAQETFPESDEPRRLILSDRSRTAKTEARLRRFSLRGSATGCTFMSKNHVDRGLRFASIPKLKTGFREIARVSIRTTSRNAVEPLRQLPKLKTCQAGILKAP